MKLIGSGHQQHEFGGRLAQLLESGSDAIVATFGTDDE
jgi:hypothetical protein